MVNSIISGMNDKVLYFSWPGFSLRKYMDYFKDIKNISECDNE